MLAAAWKQHDAAVAKVKVQVKQGSRGVGVGGLLVCVCVSVAGCSRRSRSSSSSTATVPVKTRFIFREGGLEFLILKRTLVAKKVSGFECTLDFLTQISYFERASKLAAKNAKKSGY